MYWFKGKANKTTSSVLPTKHCRIASTKESQEKNIILMSVNMIQLKEKKIGGRGYEMQCDLRSLIHKDLALSRAHKKLVNNPIIKCS